MVLIFRTSVLLLLLVIHRPGLVGADDSFSAKNILATNRFQAGTSVTLSLPLTVIGWKTVTLLTPDSRSVQTISALTEGRTSRYTLTFTLSDRLAPGPYLIDLRYGLAGRTLLKIYVDRAP